MAKKSKVVKNIQRQEMVERFASRRAELKAIIKNPKTSFYDKRMAYQKLEKMPRDANPIRIRNRCEVTGRPRGNYRKFGMSRIAFRDLASSGQLPGITKASW